MPISFFGKRFSTPIFGRASPTSAPAGRAAASSMPSENRKTDTL
ncbi:TPA: hypothetical protein ACJJ42_000862 [Neisseria meningitidis]|nr:hypothetical protein [Neisseria meningitidis]